MSTLKQRMKRWLSLLLVICMVASIASLPALATETDEMNSVAAEDYAEETQTDSDEEAEQEEASTQTTLAATQEYSSDYETNSEGALLFNGHTYMVFQLDDISTWEEAEAYCESLGGYLAIITSQEENDCLYQYMVDSGFKSAYFGLTDSEEEGVWLWVDGSVPEYTNWHSGEPNNVGQIENYGMFYYQFTNGTWNDGDFAGGVTANGGTAFICEWDGLDFDEESYSCKVGNTITISATYTFESAPDEITWTCSEENILSFSGTSVLGPFDIDGETVYYISVQVTALNAGTTTLTLSASGYTANVTVNVSRNEYMGSGVLTDIDDNLNYIFIDDDEAYIAASSDIENMKELLKNKKISNKQVIFEYTDNNVIISIYSIYDVLCLQAEAESVQTDPEQLIYSTDGTYQTDSIETTVDVYVTLSSDSPYEQSEIMKLKTNELYLDFEDITVEVHSTSNIVYFGKNLGLFKSSKKEIDIDDSKVYYNSSVPIVVNADIDDDAEPEEASDTVQITKLFQIVDGKSSSIYLSDCYVEVINQYEEETQSALDELVENYENADIRVALSATLSQYFQDGSNNGADDLATIEYIVKMLTLETIASYNSEGDNWASRLGKVTSDALKNALLKKLGLSSDVWLKSETEYVYAQYTGTNGDTIYLKITINSNMVKKVYGAWGTIYYSTDSKSISSSKKQWNTGGMLTYYNMADFADCLVNFIKIAYNQAWGNNANKAAEYLIGTPLTRVFTAAKLINNAAKVFDLNVKLPTSVSDGIFQFMVSQTKKSVSIECPVDVYIYNTSGQLCGAIEDNVINPYFSDDNVVLSVVGDKKYVTLDNEDYCILLIGNGSGTMKYQIDEYADDELVRSVTTTDIPLEEGIMYYGWIPTSLYTSAEIYELAVEDGDETIPITSDEIFIETESGEDDTDDDSDAESGDSDLESGDSDIDDDTQPGDSDTDDSDSGSGDGDTDDDTQPSEDDTIGSDIESDSTDTDEENTQPEDSDTGDNDDDDTQPEDSDTGNNDTESGEDDTTGGDIESGGTDTDEGNTQPEDSDTGDNDDDDTQPEDSDTGNNDTESGDGNTDDDTQPSEDDTTGSDSTTDDATETEDENDSDDEKNTSEDEQASSSSSTEETSESESASVDDSVQTGDTNSIVLSVIVLLLALGTMIFLIEYKRRRS